MGKKLFRLKKPVDFVLEKKSRNSKSSQESLITVGEGAVCFALQSEKKIMLLDPASTDPLKFSIKIFSPEDPDLPFEEVRPQLTEDEQQVEAEKWFEKCSDEAFQAILTKRLRDVSFKDWQRPEVYGILFQKVEKIEDIPTWKESIKTAQDSGMPQEHPLFQALLKKGEALIREEFETGSGTQIQRFDDFDDACKAGCSFDAEAWLKVLSLPDCYRPGRLANMMELTARFIRQFPAEADSLMECLQDRFVDYNQNLTNCTKERDKAHKENDDLHSKLETEKQENERNRAKLVGDLKAKDDEHKKALIDIGKNCEETFGQFKTQIINIFRLSFDEYALSAPDTLSGDIQDFSQQLADAYNELRSFLENKGIPVGEHLELRWTRA